MSLRTLSVKPLTLLNYLILLLLSIFAWLQWGESYDSTTWSRFITAISLILLGYQLLYLKIKKVSFYDFRIWYMILSNLFMFGRIYVNVVYSI